MSGFYGFLSGSLESDFRICTKADAFTLAVQGVSENLIHLLTGFNPEVQTLGLIVGMPANLVEPFRADVCHLHCSAFFLPQLLLQHPLSTI